MSAGRAAYIKHMLPKSTGKPTKYYQIVDGVVLSIIKNRGIISLKCLPPLDAKYIKVIGEREFEIAYKREAKKLRFR